MSAVKLLLALSYSVLVVAFPFWLNIGDSTATTESIILAGVFALVWVSWAATAFLLVGGKSQRSQLFGSITAIGQLAVGLGAAIVTILLTDTHWEEQGLVEIVPLVMLIAIPLLACIVFWRSSVQLGAQPDVPAFGRSAG